jgi:enoyl-CoA hydratase
MDFQTIVFDMRDQIAFVTFNRPESLNAVNRQMARELIEACREIEENSAIRIGIFTGAGDNAFSAGIDPRGGRNHQTDDRGDPRVLRWRRVGICACL